MSETKHEEILIPEEPEEYVRKLTISDKCDNCGHIAYVAVDKGDHRLLFCNHHFHKHEEAVLQWGSLVIDERPFINVKSAV